LQDPDNFYFAYLGRDFIGEAAPQL